MSAEQPQFEQHFQALQSSYELPADQIVAEVTEIEAYEAAYDDPSILHSALSAVKAVTLGGTMYKIDGAVPRGAQLDEPLPGVHLNDEDIIQVGVSFEARIMLHEKAGHEPEHLDQLPVEPAKIMQAEQKGVVLGEVPKGVTDAFEAVYRITGAQKVRDDKADGYQQGKIVWQGSYHGEVFYLSQEYDQADKNYNGVPTLLARTYDGEVEGPELVDELRDDEVQKLRDIGMSAHGIYSGVADGTIRRDNYENLVQLAQSLKETEKET